MTTLEAVQAARDLLENVTPLTTDCGKLCASACCRDDPNDEGSVAGMLLFPEEEKLYKGQEVWMEIVDSALLLEGSPVPLLVCDLPCPRRKRPLACRLFPLTPYVKNDKLTLRMDVRANPICPLCASGKAGLNPEFTEKVKEALRILWAEEKCREYLYVLTEHLKEYEFLG